MDRSRSVRLPCGHSNLCTECVQNLVKPSCPTCRACIRRRSLRTAAHASMASMSLPVRRFSHHAGVVRPRVVLVLAERSVPVESLADRLRAVNCATRSFLRQGTSNSQRIASDFTTTEVHNNIGPDLIMLNGYPVRFVTLAVKEDAEFTDIAQRVRQIAPALVVLASETSRLRTFEAVVNWDIALCNRFGSDAPRIWALLHGSFNERSSIGIQMCDVKAAIHCLGLGTGTRVHVEVQMNTKIRGDQDVRRLSREIAKFVAPSQTAARNTRPPRPQPVQTVWSIGTQLLRQCL